jgi:hypothetical protein
MRIQSCAWCCGDMDLSAGAAAVILVCRYCVRTQARSGRARMAAATTSTWRGTPDVRWAAVLLPDRRETAARVPAGRQT